MAAAFSTPILGSLLGGVASAFVGNLFGGDKQSTPAPPAPSEPTVMPTADDAAVKNAKRKSIAAQVARRGRASTILSDSESETLGG